jgi:E3 ubiquitin-protein ligase TRIP12
MICGTSRNDEEWSHVQKLSEFIVPAHGYHQKSQPYLYLLKFMTELSKDERKKFLKFVTGSPRLPNGGFGALDPKLTVVLKKPEIPKSLSKTISHEMINTAS